MGDGREQQAWEIPGMPPLGGGSLLNFEDQYPGSNNSFAWLKSEQDPRHGSALLARNSTEASDLSNLQGSLRTGKAGDEGSLSFKELHAERNKQAQRRFRKRQKEKIQELADKLTTLKNERSDLEQRQAMLEKACQMRDEELRKIREQQKAATEQEDDELARSFQGAVTLTFKQETITLTPSQIKQLSEQELAKFWSMYVKELAVLLVSVEGDEDPGSQVMGRIKALVQTELLSLYIRAALTNMQSVKKFIARAKIEEVRVTANSFDAPDRWHKVSQSLQLSLEQGKNVTVLWQKFVSSIGKIVEGRRSMHENIQHCVYSGYSGHDSAQSYLKAHEQIEALKKNLRAEHVQIHEFLVTFFLKELTVVQMAKCFVKSFPFYPDIPAISAWVAVANNDPLALSKIAALESPSPSIST